MRKAALLLTVLLLGLVAGCGVELPSSTSTPTSEPLPTSPPSPTSVSREGAVAGTVASPTSESEPISGAASCVAEAFDFPVESGIPPVTAEDHTHGPADASITLIEYADFQ